MSIDSQTALNEALKEAALHGDVDRTIDLISHGANPNSADHTGSTPMHHAGRVGSKVLVDALIDAGGNPNLADVKGITPFMAAVNANKPANAMAMIDAGADVNFQPTPDAMTPLMYAINYDAQTGSSSRTAFMLQYNGDPDGMTETPDGRYISAADIAVREIKAGAGQLATLFKTHLDRDIQAEFQAAQEGRMSREKRMSVLQAGARGAGRKFRLGPP